MLAVMFGIRPGLHSISPWAGQDLAYVVLQGPQSATHSPLCPPLPTNTLPVFGAIYGVCEPGTPSPIHVFSGLLCMEQEHRLYGGTWKSHRAVPCPSSLLTRGNNKRGGYPGKRSQKHNLVGSTGQPLWGRALPLCVQGHSELPPFEWGRPP